MSIAGGAPGKVACKQGERIFLAVDDPSGSHVTVFPIVSATGVIIDRVPVLHGKPTAYAPDNLRCLKGLALYETGKGYMDKITFYRIMTEVFIPYVNKVRATLPKTVDMHAVLIVDGHKSRFYIPTFKALQKAGIYLIILPAHSSHVTQPLDLHLNCITKSLFSSDFTQS